LKRWVWACFVTACIAGCGEPPLMAESKEVSMEGWSSEDGLLFHWDVRDTLQRQDVLLDLRHDQSYPYSNLYVFLTYRFPNGKSRVDTVECTLANKRGEWRGSGFGDLVDQRFLLQSGIQFPLRGRYGLEVRHGMRHDPIPSVANVGLRLEAHQVSSRP